MEKLEFDKNNINKELSETISRVYKRYNFIRLPREVYIDELIEHLNEEAESKDKIDDKISDFFIEYISNHLKDEEEAVRIINNYINYNLEKPKRYADTVKLLDRLNFLFSKYGYLPDPNVCKTLITTNPVLESSLRSIVEKNFDVITKGNAGSIFESVTTIFFIEAYCLHKGIHIEEDFSFDDDSFGNLSNEQLLIKEVMSKPLLTPEEERELLEKFAKTGDLNAKRILVERNLRWVVKIARGYMNRDLEFLDLFQEGSIGLMKAIEKFDINKGFRLTTYATWWIHQSMTRAIADKGRNIRIPVHTLEKLSSYYRVKNQLTKEIGREPTHNEIAEALKIDSKALADLLEQTKSTVSLNMHIDEDGESELEDFVVLPSTEFETEVIANELTEKVYEVLKKMKLTDRQIYIITKRFGLGGSTPQTLEQVGQALGITRERVRQLEAKTLRRLRNSPIAKSLLVYIQEGTQENTVIRKKDEDMEKMTLKQYLNKGKAKGCEYSDEEIEKAIAKLTDEERALLELRYAPDSKLSKMQSAQFYGCLIPKMQRLLAQPYKQSKVKKEKKVEEKSDDSAPKEEVKRKKRATTLKEYLNQGDVQYFDHEIDEMLKKLPAEDREIVKLKYTPGATLTQKQQTKFTNRICPAMKWLMSNPEATCLPIKSRGSNSSTLKEYLNKGEAQYSDEEIKTMLAKLPKEDQEIVELKYTEGATLTEKQKTRFANYICPDMKWLLQNPEATCLPRKTRGPKEESSKDETNASDLPKSPSGRKGNKEKSLKEYLNKGDRKYSDEEIEAMLLKLNDEHRAIALKKYTEGVELTKEEREKFNFTVSRRMKFLLENPNHGTKKKKTTSSKTGSTIDRAKESVSNEGLGNESDENKIETSIKQVNGSVEGDFEVGPKKEDYIKLLELLRTPTFDDMIAHLSVKEAIIVSLKLGYVDGKYFSTEAISNFLGIEEEEVRDTAKKALLMYQDSFVKMIDTAVAVVTDAPVKKIGTKN